MKPLQVFSLIILILVLGCAAPKMNIVLQESALSTKTFNESFVKYNENGSKTIDSLFCRIIDLMPLKYFPKGAYEISWIKFHPKENVFLVQVSCIDPWKKSHEVFCIQSENFRELWHLKLHEKGQIEVEDAIFIDNKCVLLVTNQHEIVSLDFETGKELWRIETPKTVNSHYFAESNKLLVRSSDAFLKLLHADTGDTVWTAELDSDYPGKPVRSNDEVLIMSGGLQKYHMDDGRHWNNDFDTHYMIDHTMTDVVADVVVSLLFGSPTSTGTTPPDFYYSCFSLPEIKKDTLYVASQGQIYAIDNETGETLWQTEKIKDLDIIHKIEIHEDVIYGKCGGYTLFLKGEGHTYSYETRGLQGLIAFNGKTKEKLWFYTASAKSEGEEGIVRDFFVLTDKIIIITEYEVISLEKETGNVLIQLAAEELRIGNISSCREIEQGFLIKGTQGISLLDKNTLDPVWSRAIHSAQPEFCFMPSEKVNVTFWKSHELVDLYSKTFYEGYFEFDPSKNIIYLLSQTEGLVGLNVLDGAIKFNIPINNPRFYIDFDRKMLIMFQNYSMSFLDISQVLNTM